MGADKLAAVTEIVKDMQNIADHSAAIKRDFYDATAALVAALELPEVDS